MIPAEADEGCCFHMILRHHDQMNATMAKPKQIIWKYMWLETLDTFGVNVQDRLAWRVVYNKEHEYNRAHDGSTEL